MLKNLTLAVLAAAAFSASAHSAFAFDNIIASPNWVNFGQVQVGSSDMEYINVQNLGDDDIQFVNAYTAGDFDFETMSMCGYLPRYGSCMIEVRFSPSVKGSSSASIQIQAGTAFATVSVMGEGVSQ